MCSTHHDRSILTARHEARRHTHTRKVYQGTAAQLPAGYQPQGGRAGCARAAALVVMVVMCVMVCGGPSVPGLAVAAGTCGLHELVLFYVPAAHHQAHGARQRVIGSRRRTAQRAGDGAQAGGLRATAVRAYLSVCVPACYWLRAACCVRGISPV